MKFKKSLGIIIAFAALISANNVFAQNTVSGKVSSNSGSAISGASVTSGSRGAVTNSEGIYSLSLAGGSATITVSFVGFIPASKTINVSGKMTVDFILNESTG